MMGMPITLADLPTTTSYQVPFIPDPNGMYAETSPIVKALYGGGGDIAAMMRDGAYAPSSSTGTGQYSQSPFQQQQQPQYYYPGNTPNPYQLPPMMPQPIGGGYSGYQNPYQQQYQPSMYSAGSYMMQPVGYCADAIVQPEPLDFSKMTFEEIYVRTAYDVQSPEVIAESMYYASKVRELDAIRSGAYSYGGTNPNTDFYGNPLPLTGNPYLDNNIRMKQASINKDMAKNHTEMMKLLSRKVHAGDMDKFEDFDAFLNQQYDPPESQLPQIDPEEEEYWRFKANIGQLRPVMLDPSWVNHCWSVHNSYKSRFPDTMGAVEYFGKAGELVLDAYNQQLAQQRRDMTNSYSHNAFQAEKEKFAQNKHGYFSSVISGQNKVKPPTSIRIDEDMEIQLPTKPGEQPTIVVHAPSFVQEYADKRNAFISAITKNVN
jgi:hypothetical protein